MSIQADRVIMAEFLVKAAAYLKELGDEPLCESDRQAIRFYADWRNRIVELRGEETYEVLRYF